ncbi:MAG: DASS family sodium-coupled anion symporter [Candidatus Omnitrophica bacterium]|nr:DASS family sodium-coupled anion symporter [Candidatus Omnitrophota bacterium]
MNRIRPLVIPLGILILLVAAWGPAWDPAHLSPEGQKAIGVFAFCLLFWMTQPIPLAITSLMIFAIVPLLGISEPKEVFSLFGSNTVFFILGALIMAGGFVKSGLSRRMAVLFLASFGRTPDLLLLGVLLSSAFLACLMPEHGVAALLYPVAIQIADSLNLEKGKSNYGKALFFALAWGSIIGGITTFLGGARNPLALELYQQFMERHQLQAGSMVSFVDWVIAALPVTLVMLFFAYWVLRILYPPEIDDVRAAHQVLEEDIREMGPISRDEMKVGAVYLVTVIGWVISGYKGDLAGNLAIIAILGSAGLFLLGTLTWKDCQQHVNWGVILMYAGAIALGKTLDGTDAGQWLVNFTLSGHQFGPVLLLAGLMAFSKLLAEGISNAAAVTIILPLALEMGLEAGIPLVTIVYAVAIPCGLVFCLPMGTPPMAICYDSDYFRIRDSLFSGTIMNIISWIVVVLAGIYYWPFAVESPPIIP